MKIINFSKIVISLFLLQCSSPAEEAGINTSLVSSSQLKNWIESEVPGLVIIDFRRKEYYLEGHIQGARNSWRNKFQDVHSEYSGRIAPKNMVETELGKLGILSDSKIVLYDDYGSMNAARMWWVLKYYGHEEIYILNGGLNDWVSSGNTISTKEVNILTTTYKFEGSTNSNLMADMMEVESAITDPDIIILDVRSDGEYVNEGHIPGAVHWDWTNTVNFENNLEFKDLELLKNQFNNLGIDKNKKIIAYCATGVRASHTTYVLKELLRYENVKNYDGSWSEWTYHKKEIKTGPHP